LNTADDSIHSDYNLTITGGTFDIKSGDDAVHADQYLILGKQNSAKFRRIRRSICLHIFRDI